MGLFLNFGAGGNLLPEPWRNLNAEHDIAKPLRFDNDSASGILAEHVIEHVTFLQGFRFLKECRRVLEPGGVLRLSFPDVGRFVSSSARGYDFNGRGLAYVAAFDELGPERVTIDQGPDRDRVRAALRHLLTGWQHQAAWSEATAAGALLVLGFANVRRCDAGAGELAGVDGHGHEVGAELAALESTIFEANK